MGENRVSVALCAYQGERYLDAQLDSIASQSRSPDELIVCDDASTDGTTDIVRRFASQAPFPVRLHVNDERLGYAKNFERAIALCESDFIFLADHDDVWVTEKLNTQLRAFRDSPDIGAVFSDADVVDERLTPKGQTLWNLVGFSPALQRRFAAEGGALSVLLKRNVVTGMTMGFRARFRDLVLPMPANWYHDCWIPLLIAAVSNIAMVSQRLVRYRQHENQSVGLPTKGLVHKVSDRRHVGAPMFLHEANQYAAASERLTARVASFPCSADVLRRFEAKTGHIRARARIRTRDGRLRPLMREVLSLNYQRYSSGLKSIAVDVLS